MPLNLEEMRAIVRKGESVIHGEGLRRRIISREEDLPTEGDLAHGDLEALTAARDGLTLRRTRLDAEIAALESEIASMNAQVAPAAPSEADAGTGSGSKRSGRTKSAGPPESGTDNERSQGTAAVGTATSDAESGAELVPPASDGAQTPAPPPPA